MKRRRWKKERQKTRPWKNERIEIEEKSEQKKMEEAMME